VRSGYQPGIRPRGEPVTGRGAIRPASLSSLHSLLSFILRFINGHLSALATARDTNDDFETLAVQLKPCASITSTRSSFSSSGTTTTEFVFRFSTKHTDNETGLVYYGYRLNNPELGRWINRDPIEEEGGTNIYCMAFNAPIMLVDRTGLDIYYHDGGGGSSGHAVLVIDPYNNEGLLQPISVEFMAEEGGVR